MMVANSFDLWQKDTFFSAAEEVQASADIMESAYRTWVRHRTEGLAPQHLDELRRELQTALGTAKWQLDEFERAVRSSYRARVDDITTTRHRQFVSAIENQISNVEAALKESYNEEGKKPLRWVNLDEEERNDLAMFLSGIPGNSKRIRDDFLKDKQFIKEDSGRNTKDSLKRDTNESKGCKDGYCNVDGSYIIDVVQSEVPETSDHSSGEADRKASARRTWSSPDNGALKVMIPDEHREKKALMLDIENTPKPSIWKPKSGNHPQAKGGISGYTQLRGDNWINQLVRRGAGSQRQLQMSINLQRSCSFRLMLALMLTIFLIVPFVFYSN